MGLPGKSKTVKVDPVRRTQPAPEPVRREPAKEPAKKEREKVGA